MANFCNICPTDCSTTTTPAIGDMSCISATSLKRSQVCGVYLRGIDADAPDDWEEANDWTDVIDNENEDGTKIKYLIGIGGMPAATVNKVDLPKGRTQTIDRDYTLTLRVDFLDDATYEFLRVLQCGTAAIKWFWFETTGGYLFGGDNGIEIEGLDTQFIYGAGKEDNQYADVIITFKSCVDPDRIENPMA